MYVGNQSCVFPAERNYCITLKTILGTQKASKLQIKLTNIKNYRCKCEENEAAHSQNDQIYVYKFLFGYISLR